MVFLPLAWARPKALITQRIHWLMPSRGVDEAVRVRGRLAPSPTGYAHLGNAWAFLLAWLAARARKGVLILRLEDIHPQRSRPEFATALLEDLRWLGLDWDQGPDVGGPAEPYAQSLRTAVYADALARLEAAGLTYPCF